MMSQAASPPQPEKAGPGFLAGGGACAELIAARDWSETPLGPLESWPQSLKTATAIILRSPVPMVMLWGEDGVMIYNDAYSVFAGGRHPRLLGSKVREGWPEVADFNHNIMEVGLAGGTLAYKDQELTLYRNGAAEQVWMNLDYSPVLDESGRPAGVLAVVVETTARVKAERRNAFLLKLGDALRPLADPVEIQETAARILGRHLGAARVAYAEDRGDDQTVTVTCNYTDGVPCLKGTYRYEDYGLGLLQEMRAGRVVIRSDIAADSNLTAAERAAHSTLGLAATLNVPLVKNGQVAAILAVHHTAPRSFSPDEIDLAKEVAERTWAAVERARAEAALRESEARFRLMADAVPQIVWITDAEGRVQLFNKQWFDYTGASYEPETAVEVANAFVHPDDAAMTISAFEEARRTGGLYRVEHRIRSRHGAYRWFLIRGEPYRDPASGEIASWFGASVDIHDRKTAEEALREFNETLETRFAEALAERQIFADVVETSTAAMMVLDFHYNILAINSANVDAIERVYGKRAKAGDNLLELLADMPEHQAQVRETWRRALRGEEFAIIAAFGDAGLERRHFEVRFNVVRDRDGRQIAASHTAYDVTDQVRAQARAEAAEAARREADALYRAYFENTPEALFVINVEPDGGFSVAQINPAHEASVGFKLEDVRGKRIEEFVPPDIAERLLESYRRVVETGIILQYREVFDLGNDPRHWDTSILPVRDSEGRVVRLIGSSRDVTRQVVAEDALRQSQKMEAMGQLTGGVAHDFNNLLTPIVGSLDMLQRKGLGGEREQRLISGALQSAERAKTLVQRLLAFARRQPLQPVAVDVSRLVTGMGDLIASTTGPQIKVVVEAGDELPPAKADPNQLEMALLNLSVNARDAMPDGGTLRISAGEERIGPGHRSHLPPGDYVRLSVADTGEGMDEATLARAVEPFFSTKGIGKGTGLGLSMVHGLASQLGGALSLQSRRGIGTNVELWLPVSHAPAEAVEENAAPEHAPLSGTALLVDDEELVRASTAEMLADLGYRVVEAGSAEEALDELNRGLAPDLLVTDHLMPGMSGTELVRRVRQMQPSLLALVVSGYAEVEGIAPDLPRLTKPFRQADLAARLAELAHPKCGAIER